MKGMSVGDALQRFAILTVGDGMVSHIPSLLVSIAAGVVITRVSTARFEAKDSEAALKWMASGGHLQKWLRKIASDASLRAPQPYRG